jgi:hypothetical protein
MAPATQTSTLGLAGYDIHTHEEPKGLMVMFARLRFHNATTESIEFRGRMPYQDDLFEVEDCNGLALQLLGVKGTWDSPNKVIATCIPPPDVLSVKPMETREFLLRLPNNFPRGLDGNHFRLCVLHRTGEICTDSMEISEVPGGRPR